MAIRKVTLPTIHKVEQLDTTMDNTRQQVQDLDSQLTDTQQTIEELIQQVQQFSDTAHKPYQSPTPPSDINVSADINVPDANPRDNPPLTSQRFSNVTLSPIKTHFMSPVRLPHLLLPTANESATPPNVAPPNTVPQSTYKMGSIPHTPQP